MVDGTAQIIFATLFGLAALVRATGTLVLALRSRPAVGDGRALRIGSKR